MSYKVEPYAIDSRVLVVTFPSGALTVSLLESVVQATRALNPIAIGYVVIVRGVSVASVDFSRISYYATTNMRPDIPKAFIGVSAPLRSFFWVYQRFTRNDPVMFAQDVEDGYSQILAYYRRHKIENP